MRTKIHVLHAGDPKFPPRLREIPQPPKLLYAQGNLDCLASVMAIAVVGTRRPTARGMRFAHAFGEKLARMGIVVVSGLALGCDTAAHEGCLEAKGQTVAILPSGLLNIYPSRNKSLAERILKSGGCLLSEYPPLEGPEPYRFVQRDRLQSGLSSAVVIVETDVSGGAMHTARFCAGQARPLACLRPDPRRLGHPMAQGNLKLIQEGKAVPLKGLQDFERFVNKPFFYKGLW